MVKGRMNRGTSQQHCARGAGLLSVSLYIALGVVVVVGVLYAYSFQQTLKRDARRLDIVRQAEIAFRQIYLRTGSHNAAAVNGCTAKNDLLALCNVASVGADASGWRDPGKYSIRVTTVPNGNSYAVSFVLEGNHQAIKKGVHTLTPQGIR